MYQVKWGILSTAKIAQTQMIPAIQRSQFGQVVAIASRSAKVHEVANKFSIEKAYESYEALLEDETIDAIYIPLPNHLHKYWAIKAAKAGKHVLCEKPIVLSEEDLYEIIEVFTQQNKLFMEAFMYQFHPQIARVKELITQNEIGQIKQFKASFSFLLDDAPTNIRMDIQKGGGALWDVGCYCLHSLNLLLNKKAHVFHFTSKNDPVYKVDTAMVGTIQLENDIVAQIDCSFESIMRNTIEIIGKYGSIRLKHAFRPDVVNGVGQIFITTEKGERVEQILGDPYKQQIDYFSKKIIENGHVDEQHQYSLKTIEAITNAYNSV